MFGLEIRFPRIFWSGKERRRAERERVFEALYVDYRCDSPPLSGSGEGKDVSAVGIRFACEQKLPKDAALRLRLRFTPGSVKKDSVEIRARVVDCYKKIGHGRYRVACDFQELDLVSQYTIKSFVEWLKARRAKNLFFRWRMKGEEE
ncbi:MAG: PilZ domain-containing protein [Candidatus Omnitrophica bacterium]|nr:PilZ domain-containing protein [Candidatus Omnitrophota bacterium]